MYRAFTTGVVLTLCLASLDRAKEAPPEKLEALPLITIEGYYTARGVSSDDKPYKSLVTISRDKHSIEVYRIYWLFEEGASYGVGLREGNTLMVGWSMNTMRGVSKFTILDTKDGPKLEGRWVSRPGEVVCNETLTLIKRME